MKPLTQEEADRINAIENREERLEAAGFNITTVAEFVGLTPEEEALIELRLSLSWAIRERRQKVGLTQAEIARRIGSSQPRVARAETGHPSVSLDLMIRTLLATGATQKEVGAAIAG